MITFDCLKKSKFDFRSELITFLFALRMRYIKGMTSRLFLVYYNQNEVKEGSSEMKNIDCMRYV